MSSIVPRVRVVTGYVPLNVLHMDATKFHDLGKRLADACDGRLIVFNDFPYEECWLAKENPPMVGANPRATDRFATDEDHARSNVVCSQFVEWANMACVTDPKIDVVVAMTYSIMKQGDFTGKPITAEHIREFLKRVKDYEFTDIPFPGISEQQGCDPFGHNWRFCGSTHIWPVKWLRPIRKWYKRSARHFIETFHKTPLDLAIWPIVETKSGLPFHWYKAEYDHTQLTNFPGR